MLGAVPTIFSRRSLLIKSEPFSQRLSWEHWACEATESIINIKTYIRNLQQQGGKSYISFWTTNMYRKYSALNIHGIM